MQNRRDFLKVLMAGGMLAGINLTPLKLLAGRGIRHLTILHTNDTHSQIEPFAENAPKFAGMGGFAQRATIIEKIRKENTNTLLFDSGDIFQGTPYFNLFSGEPEIKLMSKMGYTAATIGNHEFDNGLENIDKQLHHASFPFVSSNYDFSDTMLAGKVKKYATFKQDDLKIGVFGLGIKLEGLVDKKNFGNTVYSDPVKVASQMTELLKQELECHLVICLSHLGFEYENKKVSDRVIAQNTKYLNLILGGHTHTFLNEPVKEQNPDGDEVIIAQSGWGGVKLGKIDYFFNEKNESKSALTNTIKIFKNQV